jgi:hypothetical protein
MHTQNRYFPGELVVGISLIMTTLLLAACGVTGTTTTSAGPAAPPAATGTLGALQVTAVTMAVTPTSLAGLACGTNVTETYTATIHVAPNGPGGTVQFNYTLNNGRGQSPASLTFAQGQTSTTYAFTWSGALPADHTAPGLGGIQVTSPNQLTSPLIGPTGQCAPVAAAPVCGSNFNGSASQSSQSILTTTFGAVPLPPLSRIVPNDASGGVQGYAICSAGTAATITAFMQQTLPAYGWTLVSTSGDTQSWKSSRGIIYWSVPDPLQWTISWRV